MNFRKTAIATAVGSLTAGLMAATPAYAYKVSDNLEVNGIVFANAISVDGNADSAADDAASGFHFDRAYLETRYKPTGMDMIRITLDQKTSNSDADATKDGKVFVKYAYWQHKYSDAAVLKVGQNHTPLVDYLQNEMWRHRYVAKTFTDAVGAQTSSDLGVSLYGSGGEMFDYYVSVMNGEGYQKNPNGAGYAVMGRAEVHSGGAHLGLFAHSESKRNGVDKYDPQRQVVYGWWENDTVQIGGQYLMADDGDGGSTFKDGTGYNVLANVKLPFGNKTTAFARYDTIDKLDNGTDATLTIVGVEFEAAPGVMLAPNIQTADSGISGADDVTTIGIHGQFKF